MGNCVWGTGVILNLRIFLHPVRHNQNESKETLKTLAESAKRCLSWNQNSLKSLNTSHYYEIGKMCIDDDMPKNTGGQILSKTIRWMKQNEDPEPAASGHFVHVYVDH